MADVLKHKFNFEVGDKVRYALNVNRPERWLGTLTVVGRYDHEVAKLSDVNGEGELYEYDFLLEVVSDD